MFHYQGPADIGGIPFPAVRLAEERDGNLRSWHGDATVPASSTPEGFSPNMAGETVPVRLPDGREGTALVSSLDFDGRQWTLSLTGTGPAPGMA